MVESSKRDCDEWEGSVVWGCCSSSFVRDCESAFAAGACFINRFRLYSALYSTCQFQVAVIVDVMAHLVRPV